MSGNRRAAGAGPVNPTIVIPVRSAADGKTRLADALGSQERERLVRLMFGHVLAVATRVPSASVIVVSRCHRLLDLAAQAGAQAVLQDEGGLNEGLALACARADPERPLLSVNADLPFVGPDDLQAMIAAAAEAEVVAASDAGGTGTNALLLHRPGAIRFAFGRSSLQRHRAEAAAADLRFQVVRRPGLATDIDLPSDLPLVRHLDLAAAEDLSDQPARTARLRTRSSGTRTAYGR